MSCMSFVRRVGCRVVRPLSVPGWFLGQSLLDSLAGRLVVELLGFCFLCFVLVEGVIVMMVVEMTVFLLDPALHLDIAHRCRHISDGINHFGCNV